MTDIFDTAFCSACDAPTAHHVLGQGRLECSDCHDLRDAGPNQMWDPLASGPALTNGDAA